MKRQPTKLRTKNPNAKLISLKDIVVSDDVIVASELDRKTFFDAANNDTPPSEALIKATAFYKEFMESNKSN